MSSLSAYEQILEARDLPLRTVTIFTDRAELKRVFEVTLLQGLNNIIVDVSFFKFRCKMPILTC
jgi:hypothetical protein